MHLDVCWQARHKLAGAYRHFNVGWGSITNPAWHFLRVQAQFINHLQVCCPAAITILLLSCCCPCNTYECELSMASLALTSWSTAAGVQVEILPVYRPSPEEVSNPRLYADNVRRLMAARLGAELCDHGLTAHARLKRARIAVDWTGRCAPRSHAFCSQALSPCPCQQLLHVRSEHGA